MSDLYGLIGWNVQNSLSPLIHELFAKQTNQQIDYRTINATDETFLAEIEKFRKSGGLGLNVTAPFKIMACEASVSLDSMARKSGSVNTLSFKDGKFKGYTTDGKGFIRDLKTLGFTLQDKRVLILGAGGAVRSIVPSLLEEDVNTVVIANRSIGASLEIANKYSQFGERRKVYANLFPSIKPGFDLIVQATPVPNGDLFPIISEVLEGAFCYDLNYDQDKPTNFVSWASKKGASQAVDGLGMLVQQAAESFYIWRNARPKTQPVLNVLRQRRGF